MESLIKLKEKIESAIIKKAQLEGECQSLRRRLTEEYNCSDIPEAEKKLSHTEEEIKKKKEILQEEVNKLESFF